MFHFDIKHFKSIQTFCMILQGPILLHSFGAEQPPNVLNQTPIFLATIEACFVTFTGVTVSKKNFLKPFHQTIFNIMC